ncbi:MAG: hypothetical protein RMM08_03845 [Armatimonadota bacterium]|nr:hypothetical protein [bacterium]MDW8320476.1 hypothetical protein [Armatimonadota bacterium]
MAQLVIEGTWEEILAQQEQLRGKRVRVTVLEANTPEVQTEAKNLLEFLGPFVGCIDSEGLPDAAKVEEEFGKIIEEKFSRRRAKE